MTFSDFKKQVESNATCIYFVYKKFSGGIDPFSSDDIDVWWGNNYFPAKSYQEVYKNKFFDGNSLEDIFEEITDIEW